MNPEILFVDGYNVVHKWPDLKGLIQESLELAREVLIGRLAVYHQMTGADVTVVFDGHRTSARRASLSEVNGVKVVYTRQGNSADHYIERQAHRAASEGMPILVATSDGFHRDMLRGMGAGVIDVEELHRRVQAAEADLERTLRRDYGK